MAREFIMGARVVLRDMFSNPISSMRRASDTFRASVDRNRESLRRFQQQANSTASRTRGLASSFMSLKGAVTAIATGASMAVGYNWLVKSNADMETYRNTLAVVLKDQQKAVETLAWAEKFAASTPFEIPQIVEATTSMTTYGINAQKTLGIVGDMAAVMGKDLMQAVEAVADAQTGEVERLKEFGITKDMIEDQAKLLGTSPVNNQGQITDMKAFNAALFSIMEERYKGGMEMQSKTFKGMLSNASDFIGSMGRQLGAPIFESFKNGLGGILERANALKESGKLDAWIKGVHTGFSTTWRVIKPFLPFIEGLTIAFGTYYAVMLTVSAATKAWAAAQWLINAAMNANPIMLVVTAIGLLIGAIIWLVKNWDMAKAKGLDFMTSLKNSFISGINRIIDIINVLIEGLNRIPGVQVQALSKLEYDFSRHKTSAADFRKLDGSHALGLNRVPFDGYTAELHKDERVLTAEQNRAYETGGRRAVAAGRSVSIGKLTDKIVITGEHGDPRKMALEFIDHFYDLLDEADQVAGTGAKEALL